MPDRNGKIFCTSITSLSRISKGVGHDGGCAGTFGGLIFFDIWSATQIGDNTLSKDCTNAPAQTRLCWAGALILLFYLSLAQSVLEIFVAEGHDAAGSAAGGAGKDSGQRHAVEGIILLAIYAAFCAIQFTM